MKNIDELVAIHVMGHWNQEVVRYVEKDEFVRMCQVCGYGSKKNAVEYAENKEKLGEELTERDFEELHRINERRLYISKNFSSTCNYTGDQLIDNLNRHPRPWVRIFDASRGVKR